MSSVRYSTTLLLITLLLPASSAAQEQDACTYRSCAVRMQGNALLAGASGERITSFGFLSGPRLHPWMVVSDSASHYVDIVDHAYVSGQTMSLVGTLMWFGGLLALQGWDGEGQRVVAAGTSAVGMSLFLLGNSRISGARDAMQSAIWWYNASLVPRPGDGALSGERQVPSRPIPMAQDHARAGTVIGAVAGIAGGLAATSGMDHHQTAEGLSITLGLTAVGALIGHHIGKAIGR